MQREEPGGVGERGKKKGEAVVCRPFCVPRRSCDGEDQGRNDGGSFEASPPLDVNSVALEGYRRRGGRAHCRKNDETRRARGEVERAESEKMQGGAGVVAAASAVAGGVFGFSLSSLSSPSASPALSFPFPFTHSLFARMPAVTVVPLLPPQPTSMTLLFVFERVFFSEEIKLLSFSR